MYDKIHYKLKKKLKKKKEMLCVVSFFCNSVQNFQINIQIIEFQSSFLIIKEQFT